ncbi:ribosome small subunit-dependent GTPase A [Cupriavidus taiwanensis]|uniref:Small ribosomal subunit biogenesis GTPase RsgA n=1 Tax=Cupriavidus taiwanensis TaxID=164546 RepID=A0A7Z7JBE0_9BURK|nr:ribosome small subunit-dependent GTPase A [Cupriavidus taiwanensis]SOY88506.1 ribosome small subunit-dependent GTPase A [Cupriavidus taiwanensis]SOZ06052.1 ribosome small subunit-dependent GTPase A [Cupriavidus taiwanensis]SOZ08038.1 ribosome small subunit-dependent GTPase A [Cupriavidus taiwanensis]SPC18581.1 ribosome small subunit-dependent GTPase A [Cupriavidus taiwanensis]SPD40799.1 Small ribosomal subunit biogenesis GTPase RsgA [Cupriavidus taiwanensis]
MSRATRHRNAGGGTHAGTLTESALIVAAHGRHYVVELADGARMHAFPRGKKSDCAVGDHVSVERAAADQCVITGVAPRKNLLHRSDQFKSKLLAANIDQVIIVLATEPGFSEDLLGRALVSAEALGIRPLVVLNKTDLPERLEEARGRLALYRGLGYDTLELSVRADPAQALAALQPRVAGLASILIGQSGMGKSSLLNLLIPGVDAQTREISAKLDSGKHTTTFTRLYHLPQDWGTVDGRQGALIDSPGFQEFGLYHLSEGMLERAFPEFRPLLTACRFYNCHHVNEPGCGVLAAVASGDISERRHQLYTQLLHESSQQKPW